MDKRGRKRASRFWTGEAGSEHHLTEHGRSIATHATRCNICLHRGNSLHFSAVDYASHKTIEWVVGQLRRTP